MSNWPVVLYEPRSRFTSKTNAAWPVIVRAVRAGAVVMLEWVSLKYTEHTPLYVDVITVITAILVLAVIESRDWLDFKNARYFPIALTLLFLFWGAASGYAYFNLRSPDERNIGSHTVSPPPLVKSDITRLLAELPTLSDLVQRGPPLNAELFFLLNNQRQQISATPPNLVEAEVQATALQNEFNALRSDFLAFFREHEYDREELTTIVNWEDEHRNEKLGSITIDFTRYISQLKRLPNNATTAEIVGSGDFLEFYSALHSDLLSFSDWCAQADARLNKKRAELQAALATAQ